MKTNQYYLSYELLWLSIGLLPLLFVALLLPVSPQDYWWYLRLGQDILRTGHVPALDTYSFTYAGQPTVNHPWLSAVVFWLTYRVGGLNLTFLLRFIFIGAAYGLLWLWMRQLGLGPRLASALILVAGLSGSENWSIRPQMFAYPLFVLVLLLLWKWQRGNEKWVWILPLLSLLWANLHDSFVLIFLLGGAALIFGRGARRPLLVSLIVSFLVTFINPHGVDLWVSNVDSVLAPASRNLSAEWLPPTNLGWQMNIFFAWVLAFAPVAVLSGRRLSLLEWIWLLGFLWMAFSGLRYVIWGLFILSGSTAYLLADWDQRWLEVPDQKIKPLSNYVLAIIFFLIPLIALPGLRSILDIRPIPLVTSDTPLAATEWLSHHPELPGPLWSDLSFSSYLIFALPSRPVWVDTRFERTYPPEQYQRYMDIASGAPDWESLLDKDRINLLMVFPEGEPRLLELVSLSDQWCLQYRDADAVIFSRCRPIQ